MGAGLGAGGDDPTRTAAEAVPNRTAMDALFRSDAFAGRLGAELEDWGGGWARAGLTLTGEQRNFAGWLHGAVTFGLGDVAFAVASNSWGRLCVALSVDVQFLASASPGQRLLAECRERHRSRRTGAYLIEVHADEVLVGSLHALVHRTSRWHLGPEAWPDDWRTRH